MLKFSVFEQAVLGLSFGAGSGNLLFQRGNPILETVQLFLHGFFGLRIALIGFLDDSCHLAQVVKAIQAHPVFIFLWMIHYCVFLPAIVYVL